jgi:hypothetical protein
MLKIFIILVTTTASATLLIAYPFSPHSAAQASGGVEQVAAAGTGEGRASDKLAARPGPGSYRGLASGGRSVNWRN